MLKRPVTCSALVFGSLFFATVGCDTTPRTIVEPVIVQPVPPSREKKVDVDVDIKGRNVDVDVKTKP